MVGSRREGKGPAPARRHECGGNECAYLAKGVRRLFGPSWKGASGGPGRMGRDVRVRVREARGTGSGIQGEFFVLFLGCSILWDDGGLGAGDWKRRHGKCFVSVK